MTAICQFNQKMKTLETCVARLFILTWYTSGNWSLACSLSFPQSACFGPAARLEITAAAVSTPVGQAGCPVLNLCPWNMLYLCVNVGSVWICKLSGSSTAVPSSVACNGLLTEVRANTLLFHKGGRKREGHPSRYHTCQDRVPHHHGLSRSDKEN